MYFYFDKSKYYISAKKYPYVSQEQIRNHNQAAEELEMLTKKGSQLSAEIEKRNNTGAMILGLLLAAPVFFLVLNAGENNFYLALFNTVFPALLTFGVGYGIAFGIAEFISKNNPELKSQESIIRKKTQCLDKQLLTFEGLKKKHAQYWLSMDGWRFEREVAKLYAAHGYDAVVTKGSDDGGIDIFLTRNNTRLGVQCKNYHKPVAQAVIRELAGAMMHENLDGGIVIASSGYTKRAKEFAENKPIKLLDINDVLRMHAKTLT